MGLGLDSVDEGAFGQRKAEMTPVQVQSGTWVEDGTAAPGEKE